jgi:uncharacterized protein (DUF302 family)
MARYQMTTTVSGSFDQVKARVMEALKAQGFGVITEIDMQKTLKEKLGSELEPYQILGACNPALAHKALEADRTIGLLLPCNVVLRSTSEGIEVSILDPEVMFEVVEPAIRDMVAPLAGNARERLVRALETL